MRSVDDVKQALLAYLLDTVPARLTAIDTETGATTPAVALWAPHAATAPRMDDVDTWPAVFIDETEVVRHRMVDRTTGGDPLYIVDYRFTIEVWCRSVRLDRDSQAFEDAQAIRARIDRAIRESLLDRSPNDHAVVLSVATDPDETTLTSRYSPLFTTQAGQEAAAVEIECVITSAETLPRPYASEAPTGVDVLTEHLEEQ